MRLDARIDKNESTGPKGSKWFCSSQAYSINSTPPLGAPAWAIQKLIEGIFQYSIMLILSYYR